MKLLKELKRRNVIRVGAAYVVIGWLLLQVADTLTPALHLPEWIMSGIALVLILGIIPTLLFSWAYELTPDGIKKDSEVDQTNSGTSQTAKKLDVITLVAVIAIAVLIAWQQMNPSALTPSSAKNADQTSNS
jgi:adenylate cyclase